MQGFFRFAMVDNDFDLRVLSFLCRAQVSKHF
jgi:hypothetical protein